MGKKPFSFEQVRRDLKGGQEEALLRKLWVAAGGETNGGVGLQAILRGEFRIELVDATIKLIDTTGRAIPPKNFGFEVVDPNRQFYVTPPEFDLRAIHARMRELLPSEFEIQPFEQFMLDFEVIMTEIAENRQVANIKNGVHLPLPVPKCAVGGNYGHELEDKFLPLVQSAYQRMFPDRQFQNWRKNDLDGKVKVVDGTRHDRFLRTMRERPFTVVYFQPFQGFGIEADRAMIKLLPSNWLLAGGIDTSLAFAAYPATLARDYNTTVADCAALQWSGPEFSLCLLPHVEKLGFGLRYLSPDVNCSGGVLVLRQS